MSRISGISWLALAFLASITQFAAAGDHCCAQCGCAEPCRRVCRLVTEEKKVEVTCWGSKEEYFCLPRPSVSGCEHCETVCGECDPSGDITAPYSEPKRFRWREWIPGCAEVHTRTRLLKKTTTVKVPTHKWVVEDLCTRCAAGTQQKKEEKPTAALPAEISGSDTEVR